MIKLFTKLLTASAITFAALCTFACSLNLAGTAEETNQSANLPSPPEESSSGSEDSPIPDEPSSSSLTNQNSQISSSSTTEAPNNMDPIKPSSSSRTDGNGEAGSPDIGYIDYAQTLDTYLKKYGITDITFDEHVIAYNKTFVSCDATKSTCVESPNLDNFKTIGLHKASTTAELNSLSAIFPATAKAMGGTLHEVDECPLYVLNINDTSPTAHVLTEISKDTIKIVNISDQCDYEARPFEMHVGFLFAYCGELSENFQIATTFMHLDSSRCINFDYNESINKKLSKLQIN